MNDQKTIKQWFDESLSEGIPLEREYKQEAIFYKGFKIIKKEQHYEIKDIRCNNYYGDLTSHQTKTLLENGFVKGVRRLNYEVNKKRVESYYKELEGLFTSKEVYLNKFETNIKFYTKRLNNCKARITDVISDLFFYKAKIKQYEEQQLLTNK